MEISLAKLESKNLLKEEVLVLAEYKQGNKPSLSKEFKVIDKELHSLLSDVIDEEEFKFANASTLVIRCAAEKTRKIILVGLGDKKELDLAAERKAIAAAIRKARSIKAKSLAFVSIKNAELIAETATLLSYEFNKYKKEDEKAYTGISSLSILANTAAKEDKNAIKNAQAIAEATNYARDLVWEPACTVTPSFLAAEAKKIKGANFKVTVREKAWCKKQDMGSYLAVAQGSDEPPKFIEMCYEPTGKITKHIAVVGKGVTFDSGGLSLKPSKAMEMMKEDMGGSAATLGLMKALVALQPKGVKVTGIIAATENMPSGKAYRPGDVITAMNGKTIEVNNTDAEGRLTLADAVAYASKQNPDCIIDIATLTGACMVALGNVCAGLMTNDQKLLDTFKKSADKQGELMWQLPLYEEYKDSLKSSIADLINAGSKGKAGAQNGGLFIQEFIGEVKGKQIPWLHIDIAGPVWLDSPNSWSPKGASGIPVRSLVDFITN